MLSKRLPAFSLLELLLSIGIVAIFSGIIYPVSINLYRRSSVDATTDTIIQHLQHAQRFADYNRFDSPWGVHINDNKILIFAGTSRETRDTDQDITSPIPKSVTVDERTYIFERLTGIPDNAGAFRVRNDLKTNTIRIAPNGVIEKHIPDEK